MERVERKGKVRRAAGDEELEEVEGKIVASGKLLWECRGCGKMNEMRFYYGAWPMIGECEICGGRFRVL